MMKKIFAGAIAAFFATAAFAQNAGTVANHAYAIGKGPNVSGYTSLLCASGQLAIGSATDPTCRTMSGDATINATGVLTLATVNANVGTFGSATQCITTTKNAKGLTTAISAATCTPAVGSITGLGTGVAAALAVNTNISGGIITPTPVRAGDIVYWNGSAWVTLPGNNSGTLVLQETSAGVPSWAAAGSGTVTSITPGAGLVSSITAACSQTAVTTAGTLSDARCINAQSGTTYAIVDGDRAKLITATNAAAQAYSIAQAGAASAFVSGWFTEIQNNSTNAAGIITITPTTSTINGAATLKIQPGQSARIVSDGTNYQVFGTPGTSELVVSTVNNPGSGITNGVTANVTSISVPVGTWEVSGQIGFSGAATTTVNSAVGGPSIVSATLDATNGRQFSNYYQGSTVFANTAIQEALPTTRFTFTSTTTIFLTANLNFAVSTASAFGTIRAARVSN